MSWKMRLALVLSLIAFGLSFWAMHLSSEAEATAERNRHRTSYVDRQLRLAEAILEMDREDPPTLDVAPVPYASAPVLVDSSGEPSEQHLEDGKQLLAELCDRFQVQLGETDEDWLPSEEAMHYHIGEYLVGQLAAKDPTMEYVARLLGDEFATQWSEYWVLFENCDPSSKLSDFIDFPTHEDVAHLWSLPEGEERFTKWLEFEHYADIIDDERNARALLLRSRYPDLSDEEFDELRERDRVYVAIKRAQNNMEEWSAYWWDSLFSLDTAYSHWAFLVRVAERHLN